MADPIAARDYRDLVQVEDPRLSPDGERVAFVRKVPDGDEEYETTVHVVPAGGGETRQFTAREGQDAAPRWSPDGEYLAFTSVRGDADRPQLWLLPTDGGEARQVTDVVGGVAAPVWSPDGDRLAFVQETTTEERERGLDLDDEEAYEREEPDPRVIDRTVYRADAAYVDGTRSHVYTVTLDGEVRRHTDGDRDVVSPEFGDGDTLYCAVCRAPDPDDSVEWDVDALDLPTGERETVAETTAWEPPLAATERYLAYPRTPPERLAMRQREVEVLDRETGETVTPTAGLDRTAGAFAWDAARGELYVLTPDEGSVAVRRFAPAEATEPRVVVDAGEATALTVRDGRVALARSEWDHRGDVFLAEADAGDGDGVVRRLTEVNAGYLAAHDVAEPEEVRFESEGEAVQGWLLTPPGEGTGPHPLAVEVHGGPHAMWTTSGTMWHEYQTLAARGYAVFWCNPRGSTGYGEAFATAIADDWGAVTARDVLAGVDAVCEREDVDGTDLHLTGGSFGGFVTAWIVGHDDRFSSAVAQRGVYDLTGFYGSTDAFRLVEDDFDAVPWEDYADLWAQSPAAHAPAVDTPTLLVHADADYRVPVNNAELLYRFYRKLGVETRLVRYPRDGHELSRSGEPAHVVDRLERIVRWFDGYSDSFDVPPANERGDEGLSAAASGGPEEEGDESG